MPLTGPYWRPDKSYQFSESLITASRRQELRIGAAEGVAEKVEGLHGTLLAAP
jgi:hypothetical protein